MLIAYEYGADSVEFDIQLTKDGQLACFHDYTLEYRTNGTGEISDYTMDELKLLDIGYGYTADGGKTYPFRGQGVGLMPSIIEVFETFPDKDLLIHIRSYSVEFIIIHTAIHHKTHPSKLNECVTKEKDD